MILSEHAMTGEEITHAIHALADKITEQHPSLEGVVLVGILSAGYPVADRLKVAIEKKTGITLPIGKLDSSLYRDDLLSRGQFVTLRETDIPFNLTNKTLILVDDVLFSGRTIRASLNALSDFGRPASIELAVLIDRGHRQLPIFANFIGKTLLTEKTDYIKVRLCEIDGEDEVVLTTQRG